MAIVTREGPVVAVAFLVVVELAGIDEGRHALVALEGPFLLHGDWQKRTVALPSGRGGTDGRLNVHGGLVLRLLFRFGLLLWLRLGLRIYRLYL